jgi:uncharacterized protein
MQQLMLPTPFNYRLSVWVEGDETASHTVVLVHGFGTNKHETAGYFDDLVVVLGRNYRVVRFDFAGLGDSEGTLSTMTYERQAEELQVVLEWVRQQFAGQISIVAQSMGCFITALCNPDGIARTVFTGIPNIHTERIVDRIAQRFAKKPESVVNIQGVSTILRSSGELQTIHADFWQSILRFRPLEKVAAYAAKTKLLIIHPNQDDVVGTDDLDGYSELENVTVRHLDGDHSYTKPEDREKVIQEVGRWISLHLSKLSESEQFASPCWTSELGI